jgi:hypothetical protein
MYARTRRVPVATADSQLCDIGQIFLVKIDVEGLELDVLHGMKETVSKHRPPIYFEVMGYGHLQSGNYSRAYFGELTTDQTSRLVINRKKNQRELLAFFVQHDYLLYRCSNDGAIEPASSLDPGPDEDAGEMNYLAMPKELCEEFNHANSRDVGCQAD